MIQNIQNWVLDSFVRSISKNNCPKWDSNLLKELNDIHQKWSWMEIWCTALKGETITANYFENENMTGGKCEEIICWFFLTVRHDLSAIIIEQDNEDSENWLKLVCSLIKNLPADRWEKLDLLYGLFVQQAFKAQERTRKMRVGISNVSSYLLKAVFLKHKNSFRPVSKLC